MSKLHRLPRVMVIVGPTAVGKTELSLRLAERIDGEIISMDSRLIYRGMDIGTAKPTKAEQARVPHHMIDLVEPDENWSLALFRKQALREIEGVLERGHVPILVGGTGQYVRALMEGWVIPSQRPDEKLRNKLEEWGREIGAPALHDRLAVLDADAAAVIEPSNLRRSVRALEVIFKTGMKFSSQRQKEAPDYEFMLVGLNRPRAELYQRVDERIEKMFVDGLVEEVQNLLAKGYSEANPPLSAIGYREVIDVIRGNMTLEDAKVQMRRKTREFIRRQANWFKTSDENIHWYEMQPDPLERILTNMRIAN
ncbi:MAG: tRNA (adenosine(37)-N6)-dimethylallyltransferase MiaA [Anaerolineaceae bacterium]